MKQEVKSKLKNTKELWKFINFKIKGSNGKDKNNINIVNVNSKKIVNKKQIANAFNSFFSEIGLILAKNIEQPKNKKINMPKWNTNSMYLEPTNAFEIFEIIKNLSNKAGGVDNISSKSLKMLATFICTPLEYIYLTFAF